jgi:hypothetical protein
LGMFWKVVLQLLRIVAEIMDFNETAAAGDF